MEVVLGLHWVDSIWDTKVYVLLEAERVVIVDAGTPGRAGAVWRYLDSLGYPPGRADELWLTHADIDHMGSVAALKTSSGAKVVAHHADAPLVDGTAQRELGPVLLSAGYERIFNWAIRNLFRYRPTPVDHLVEDGEDLGSWQVIHTPGHTPGSVSFYHLKHKLIIVGDALNYRRGRLGAPPLLFTPDMAAAHESIHKIAALDFEICCFGHGPPLARDAAERVREFALSLSL
jgi:glyoxylase-like metal-dependent hydrolase (beta-lactamase superfamily II)